MGPRVVVIGGGSAYMPGIAFAFAKASAAFPDATLVLHDLDRDALRLQERLTGAIMRSRGASGIGVEAHIDRAPALEGADVVLAAFRPGGFEARHLDEKIAIEHGVIGQETAGPGGFAMALRSVPVVLAIADELRRVGNDGAVMLNYTNPVQIVSEAMARFASGVPYVGLCDQTEGERRFLGRLMGCDPRSIELDTCGTNHMTFTRGVSIDGQDRTVSVWARLDTLVLDELETEAERRIVRLFRMFGRIPSEYMQYFLFHDEVLAEQRAQGRTRAEEIMAILPDVLASYRAEASSDHPEPSMARASEEHGDFAVSVMAAMLGGERARFVLNLPNEGQVEDLPGMAIVETPAWVHGRVVEPVPQGSLPPEVSGMVRQVAAHAELTAEAAVTGNRALAVEALALHPLVRSVGTAESLVDAYLHAHADLLPQFPGDVNPLDAHPPLALDDVLATVVDGRTKGMPEEEVALGDVPARGLSLADLSLPVMSLRSSALEHNVTLTADYCRRAGVSLAPHGKTTMSPQLWDRQLRAGAWGLTAATAQQAQVMRGVGVRRVMIANELVDPGSIRWAAACLEDPDLELWSWVDSPDAVALLEAGMRELGGGGSHRVLVELGHPGGRTGARSVADAVEVAASVAASPVLELRGVAGYEGTVCAERRLECLDEVRRYLGDLHALSIAVLIEGFIDERHEMLVTAGGSTFFDLAAEGLTLPRPEHAGGVRVVIRAGCTLTHDHGFYAERSPFAAVEDPAGRFHPALELWAAVSSLPEPGLAIVGFGRRDTSFDQGLPVPISIQGRDGTRRDARGITVDRVADQHAFCRVDEGFALAVGEVVRFGVSHPCTAFDKWRVLPVLDDDDVVVEAVATYF